MKKTKTKTIKYFSRKGEVLQAIVRGAWLSILTGYLILMMMVPVDISYPGFSLAVCLMITMLYVLYILPCWLIGVVILQVIADRYAKKTPGLKEPIKDRDAIRKWVTLLVAIIIGVILAMVTPK